MRNQKGQTLIEALIALGAAIVVMAAITVGAVSSLSTTEFNSNSNLATHYAQEGIEFANYLAQANWTKFQTYQGDYCYDNQATDLVLKGLNSCSLSVAPIFTRVLSINQSGGGQCKSSVYVLVTVSWKDGACTSPSLPFCHKVSLETCLSGIDAISPP